MSNVEKTLFQVIIEITNCRDLEHLQKIDYIFSLGTRSIHYSWEFDQVEYLGQALTWKDKKEVQKVIDRQIKIIHSER